LVLPVALVDAEKEAPRGPPDCRQRQLSGGITYPGEVLDEA
jgi:hypothetical protein